MAGKKDYLSGVYRSGVFNAYGVVGNYKVTKFDSGSNRVARDLANAQKEVHGTFKDGVFRPVSAEDGEGFGKYFELNGQKYGIDHEGNLYDSSGTVSGKVGVDGKPILARAENSRDGAGNRSGLLRRERMKTSVGERDFYETDTSNSLVDWLSKSNVVLRKLGAEKSGYVIQKDFIVYETEIPEFRRVGGDIPLYGANVSHAEDGRRLLILDSRLKPHEKLALATHELAHIAQNHNPRSARETAENEREAQTRAIKHLATLYEDYGALQKFAKSSGFDVGYFSRRDISRAIGLLVQGRKYFGVVDSDLAEHSSTFRSVARDLEGMVSFFALAGSIFFVGSNLTGNAITNMSSMASSWFGVGLFSVGLFSAILYLSNKKK